MRVVSAAGASAVTLAVTVSRSGSGVPGRQLCSRVAIVAAQYVVVVAAMSRRCLGVVAFGDRGVAVAEAASAELPAFTGRGVGVRVGIAKRRGGGSSRRRRGGAVSGSGRRDGGRPSCRCSVWRWCRSSSWTTPSRLIPAPG